MKLALASPAPQLGARCVGLCRPVPRTWLMDEAHETTPWDSLVARALEGDPSAERALVDALWPSVMQRIHRHCPRRETAEDLAQDVFLKVFSKLEQFRGGNLEAWVDRIARNVCYDALRKQRVRPEWTFTDVGTLPEEAPDPHSVDVNDLEAAEVIAKLFQQLPDEVAWLLREVELEQRSISEVAADMGWTQTAARLRLFRARRKLRSVFNRWQEEVADEK